MTQELSSTSERQAENKLLISSTSEQPKEEPQPESNRAEQALETSEQPKQQLPTNGDVSSSEMQRATSEQKLDNTHLQCQHGSLKPEQSANTKLVSSVSPIAAACTSQANGIQRRRQSKSCVGRASMLHQSFLLPTRYVDSASWLH